MSGAKPKLTPTQITEIRARLKRREAAQVIAHDYHVSRSTIQNIRHGRIKDGVKQHEVPIPYRPNQLKPPESIYNLPDEAYNVLIALDRFIAAHGYSPLFDELGEMCFMARSTVLIHVRRLKAWGFVDYLPGNAGRRTIHLTTQAKEQMTRLSKPCRPEA